MYKDKKDSKTGRLQAGRRTGGMLRTPQGYPFCRGPQGPRDSRERERVLVCVRLPCLGTLVLSVSAGALVKDAGGPTSRHSPEELPVIVAPLSETSVQRRLVEVGPPGRRGFLGQHHKRERKEAPVQKLQRKTTRENKPNLGVLL